MANEDLQTSLGINLTAFRQGLQGAVRATQNLGSTMRSVAGQVTNSLRSIDNGVNNTKKNFADLERIVGGIVLAQGFYGAKSGIESATASLVTFIDDLDRAQISLDYFLKTPEQARSFLEDVKDFAAETAFDTNQALLLSRRLLSGGFAANDIRNTLETLNDSLAASGLSTDKLNNLVLALTQVRTNGKLAGQELRQLGETGLDIRGILSEKLGLSGEDLNNVGDLNIDGVRAVEAILEGLEERYGGAAERLADTLFAAFQSISDGFKILGDAAFAAPYQVFLNSILRIRDIIEEARDLLRTQGLGGVLEGLFPPEVQTAIRLITGSLKNFGQAFKNIAGIVGPVAKSLGVILVNALGLVLPPLSKLIEIITGVIKTAIEVFPPLKYLAAAIVGLLVAQVVTNVMLVFWRVLRIGLIAQSVAKAVLLLAGAVKTLSLALIRSPLGIVIALGAALAYVTGVADALFRALDRLVQKFAQLGGFKIEDQLPVEDIDLVDSADFEGKGAFAGGAFGDGFADEADKKFKKFLATFDEIFEVPEKEGEDAGAQVPVPGLPTGPDGKIKVDDLGLDELPRKIELPELVFPPILPPILPPLPPLPQFEPIRIPVQLLKPLPITLPTFEPIRIPVTILSPVLQPGFTLPRFEPITIGLNLPSLQPINVFGLGIIGALQPAFTAIRNFGTSLGGVLSGVGSFVGSIGNALNPLNVFTGGFQRLLETVGNFGINLGNLVNTVGDFGINLTPLINTVGQFGINMRSLVETVGDFGINLSPLIETVGQFGINLGRLVETVGDFGINLGFLSGELPSLAALFSALGAAVGLNAETFAQWKTTVTAVVKAVFDGIKSSVTDFAAQIPTAIQTALASIAKFWEQHKGVIINIALLVVSGLLTVFTGGLGGIAAFIVAWIPRAFQVFTRIGPLVATAIRGLPGIFTGVWNTVSRAIPGVINGIVTFFRGLPGKIFDAIKSIPSTIAGVFNNIKLPSFSTAVDGVKATFNKVSPITGFASGGIIGKDSIVRVGEGGRKEAIIPLQNQQAMQPFVDAVVQGLQGSGTNNSNTNPGTEGQQILYVGTLIADDRSLKELERKMKVVRANEQKRGGRRDDVT